MVDFPQPDSPTNAKLWFGSIFKEKPLSTQLSALLGYLNQTFLNSMEPVIFKELS
eukprot:CAMPEP_0170555358 /NCGR_PEP_ID=MMETSP0211-20121228/13261_1 /TAXON_ID=311385 /ORGANISM="Pseudokeronopsis sp., Strain OXSARD2" /LENGTH=54 /DNA_ID=CAMNT_0010865145 /DNA_START=404 /DNA_END=568 /DNA_ORIENTATION=-